MFDRDCNQVLCDNVLANPCYIKENCRVTLKTWVLISFFHSWEWMAGDYPPFNPAAFTADGWCHNPSWVSKPLTDRGREWDLTGYMHLRLAELIKCAKDQDVYVEFSWRPLTLHVYENKARLADEQQLFATTSTYTSNMTYPLYTHMRDISSRPMYAPFASAIEGVYKTLFLLNMGHNNMTVHVDVRIPRVVIIMESYNKGVSHMGLECMRRLHETPLVKDVVIGLVTGAPHAYLQVSVRVCARVFDGGVQVDFGVKTIVRETRSTPQEWAATAMESRRLQRGGGGSARLVRAGSRSAIVADRARTRYRRGLLGSPLRRGYSIHAAIADHRLRLGD